MFGLSTIRSINANYRHMQEYAKALNTNEPHDIATLGARKKGKGKGKSMGGKCCAKDSSCTEIADC